MSNFMKRQKSWPPVDTSGAMIAADEDRDCRESVQVDDRPLTAAAEPEVNSERGYRYDRLIQLWRNLEKAEIHDTSEITQTASSAIPAAERNISLSRGNCDLVEDEWHMKLVSDVLDDAELLINSSAAMSDFEFPSQTPQELLMTRKLEHNENTWREADLEQLEDETEVLETSWMQLKKQKLTQRMRQKLEEHFVQRFTRCCQRETLEVYQSEYLSQHAQLKENSPNSDGICHFKTQNKGSKNSEPQTSELNFKNYHFWQNGTFSKTFALSSDKWETPLSRKVDKSVSYKMLKNLLLKQYSKKVGAQHTGNKEAQEDRMRQATENEASKIVSGVHQVNNEEAQKDKTRQFTQENNKGKSEVQNTSSGKALKDQRKQLSCEDDSKGKCEVKQIRNKEALESETKLSSKEEDVNDKDRSAQHTKLPCPLCTVDGGIKCVCERSWSLMGKKAEEEKLNDSHNLYSKTQDSDRQSSYRCDKKVGLVVQPVSPANNLTSNQNLQLIPMRYSFFTYLKMLADLLAEVFGVKTLLNAAGYRT